MNTSLEIIAVVLSLCYLFFLIREQLICWFFGIAASLFSIVLFYRTGLYSEAILYVYYVIIGVYGYSLWRKKLESNNRLKVSVISTQNHILLLTIAFSLAYFLGYIFDTYTNASNPYLDACTTIFSFLASYLEARKILSAWIFWLIINGLTLVLYAQESLYWYFLLTLVYFIFSVIGYRKWKKSMSRKQ